MPAPLRDFAHLDKKAALLGQGKKIEIWSQTEREAQRDEYLALDEQEPMTLENLTDISL